MDEYTSEIMMGGTNTIVLHNTCEVCQVGNIWGFAMGEEQICLVGKKNEISTPNFLKCLFFHSVYSFCQLTFLNLLEALYTLQTYTPQPSFVSLVYLYWLIPTPGYKCLTCGQPVHMNEHLVDQQLEFAGCCRHLPLCGNLFCSSIIATCREIWVK